MDLIDQYLALFRIAADSPAKEKLVAGLSREQMEKTIAAHKSAERPEAWIRRCEALFNMGLGDCLEDELVAGARMERLEEELKKASDNRDFKHMKRVQAAIGAECKRQGMGQLTDLEKKVWRISEYLHFRDGRPATDPELHRRFKEEYPKLRHDFKTIKRARIRLELKYSKGKPGPKPK